MKRFRVPVGHGIAGLVPRPLTGNCVYATVGRARIADRLPIEDPREALARRIGQFWRALLREGMLAMVRALGDCDFSMPQLATLMLPQEQGEPTIKQVAQTLGRSVSATGRMLDQLVRRGLVSRREDGRARRVKRVAITQEGRVFLSASELQRADSQLAVMQYLAPEERAEVMRAMGLLA